MTNTEILSEPISPPATSQTHLKLGVTFDLNGKTISLQPKEAIDKIKEDGIELTLPERMELGTAGSGIDSILTKLGSTYRTVKPALPESGKEYIYIVDKLPKLLTTVYDKVVTAQLNVEKFHAKIPGSKTKETEIKYTIGLSATWDIKGDETGLTLTGIYFEVSNEEVPAVSAT